MRKLFKKIFFLFVSFMVLGSCCSENIGYTPDNDYVPTVFGTATSYQVVAVDEGHESLHHIACPGNCIRTYEPFADFWRAQGHLVWQSFPENPFEVNIPNVGVFPATTYVLPTPRQTFTSEEIAQITAFVFAGGNLYASTDHGPIIPEKIRSLLEAFGVEVMNLQVNCAETDCPLSPSEDGQIPLYYPVPSTKVYQGTAFMEPFANSGARCELRFQAGAYVWAGDYSSSVATYPTGTPAEGFCQAVSIQHGAGRVFLSGSSEPASAMINPMKMGEQRQGLSDPNNPHGEEWLANIIRWFNHE